MKKTFKAPRLPLRTNHACPRLQFKQCYTLYKRPLRDRDIVLKAQEGGGGAFNFFYRDVKT